MVALIFLVNLSYPEWTGGWSTGPRLLIPLIPFAMIPVAGLIGGDSRLAKVATATASVLGLIGGIEMLLFQGAGGRIPHQELEPLSNAVWPLWTGQVPYPGWQFGEQFSPTLVSLFMPETIKRLSPSLRFIQFLPLVLVQVITIAGFWRFTASHAKPSVQADQ